MKRKSNRIRSKRRFFLSITILIVVLGVSVFVGLNVYIDKSGEPVNSAATEEFIVVSIPSGSSTSKIAAILDEYDLVQSASKFKFLTKLAGNDGAFKAGEYTLSPSMTVKEIMDTLLSGRSNTKRFTIPEGYTIAKTADKLAEEGFIDRETFMNELAEGDFDYKFMEYVPEGENRFEGFLFPETYDVYTTATEKEIINRMLSQFDKEFKEEYYVRAQELGWHPNEIITIASMIEAEAKVADDRRLISSVIYNRLKIGMPLQLDATVQYALGQTKERLSDKDTKIDSPYNTYKIAGLPPGPICSPGADSIYAALYPEDTEYIYYVLKPDKSGAHNFAKTYPEFLKYKNQYLKSL